MAAAFLVSNSAVGAGFVYESVPANRRPMSFLVDTDSVLGVADPRGVAQQLMDAWNAVPGALDVFGVASAGASYRGANAKSLFGVFTDGQRELAWDDDGSIFSAFGLSGGLLGITIKSVDVSSGQILDVLVVINTSPAALASPNATAEELFRATLLHELGHTVGLGHTPVGMINGTSTGLEPVPGAAIPTMYPFRVPQQPAEGGTIELDDRAGLARIYPQSTSGFGSISGRVRSLSGAPVNEIAVRAVSAGGEHAGSLTNVDGTEQGTYTIPNLPPGSYRVLIETVNGRSGVDADAIAPPPGPKLGSNAFVYATDELWQPGDTYDPASDDPAAAVSVQVRAGRDTGSIDFVLNARPIVDGATLPGLLDSGDARVPDAAGALHLAEFFVFHGQAGQTAQLFANAPGFVPQLRLLDPSSLGAEAEHLPAGGSTASLSRTLSQTGFYTVVLFARAAAGAPQGSGAYTLSLQGAGGPLPPPPTPAPAAASLGPENPGPRSVGNAVCGGAMLQIRLQAPSHEELWVDALTLRASGTADDAADVTRVAVIHDVNGNGRPEGGERVLGTGAFSADDGELVLGGLDFEVDAGATADLLVVYDVAVVSAAPQQAFTLFPWVLAAGTGLGAACFGRRAAALLALAALFPLGCGGGGGGGGCSTEFDPQGIIVTFACRVDPSGILAFRPSSTTPLALPASTLQSATLQVSR